MKAYVLTTGGVFVLLVAAHLGRVMQEGVALLKQPAFAITSVLSIVLAIWSWWVFRRLPPGDRRA